MQDFSNYPYIIQLQDLEKTARKVIENGLSVTVIINGEYYDVDLDGSKLRDWTR